MINRDNWGWRARFGIFIVASEAVPESEWWAMMPSGVSVHAARIDAPAPWANWQHASHSQLVLADDLLRGAHNFASMRLDAVVVGHSSSSLLGGAGWDTAVTDALSQTLTDDVQLTTNGLDCIAALRASAVQRPLLVFPPWFGPSLIDAGSRYFAGAGFDPAGSLAIDAGRQWRDLPANQLYAHGMGFEQDVESTYRQIRTAMPASAEGVLIVGTGFRCVGIIAALENDLGRPVVTANQASLWHCLRMTGIAAGINGYGALLR